MTLALYIWTISDIVSVISLLFAIISGIFVFVQWKRSIKIRRAEFINQLIEHIRFDDDLSYVVYLVDYNQDWYNINFHKDKLESKIDKLFSHIDYICYLYSTGNISKKEFCIFQYDIHRVCISLSSQKYLWNLFHFSSKNKAPCPFQYLIDYGCENHLFPDDFKKNKLLYDKFLNFN